MDVNANPRRDIQGWSEATVDDLKAANENALSTGPFGSSIGSRFFTSAGVPVIRGNNLAADGRTHLIDNELVFVSEAKAAEFRRSSVFEGDLIFTCWGTINQVGLISKQSAYPRYIISNKQMKFTPDPWKADSLFLFYLFSGPELQRQIKNQSIGTSVPGFNLGQLRGLRFHIPDLLRQKAIAEVLSNADALIESLEQLIVKKRQIKQGAMQELLTGKKRLPGFSGDWEKKMLGGVVDIRKGELITEKNSEPGLVPVIAGGKEPAYFHNLPNRWSKTITVSGSGANAGYVAFHEMPIFASDCSTIGEGPTYLVKFIYYVLLLNQNEIYKAQTGGAQPHIHPGDLRPLKISVPTTKAEQSAIATILSDMDAEIAALEEKLAKARDIKQGMMQDLLTGRIRLL